MIFPRLRALLSPLQKTPLHPQWLVFRKADHSKSRICARIQGRLLDIGCGNKPLQSWLPPEVEYIGLDYPITVAKGYAGQADVFGDGQRLPFVDACFDAVTLLDVMEHLPCPETAFTEMVRVTQTGGLLITQTPFMYPLHDLPHDFQRWTGQGLAAFCEHHNVELIELQHHGHPLETAAALMNLALVKGLLESLQKRHPGILLLPLAIVFIPIINLFGRLLACLLPDDGFMPLGYTAIFRKRV